MTITGLIQQSRQEDTHTYIKEYRRKALELRRVRSILPTLLLEPSKALSTYKNQRYYIKHLLDLYVHLRSLDLSHTLAYKLLGIGHRRLNRFIRRLLIMKQVNIILNTSGLPNTPLNVLLSWIIQLMNREPFRSRDIRPEYIGICRSIGIIPKHPAVYD